jgi:hypothetical protein
VYHGARDADVENLDHSRYDARPCKRRRHGNGGGMDKALGTWWEVLDDLKVELFWYDACHGCVSIRLAMR